MTRTLILAENTFREAIRDRLLYVVLVLGGLILGGSVLVAPLTLGENAKIIVDLGAGNCEKAARLFACSWALWRAAGKKVRLAPPVGYIPPLNLTLQEQVRGERLGGLTTAGEFVKRVRQTARMLGALHRLSIPLFTRRRGETECAQVREVRTISPATM